MHVVRLVLGVGILCLDLFFFFGEGDAEDVTDGDDGTDDAHYTERIGAGITQGNGLTRVVQLVQCLLCGTQTGSVRHCTVQDTDHHRQLHASIGQEIDGQCHHDVQQDDAYRQQIQCHATLLEGRKERRTHLQTYAEYKQDKAEFAQEMQDMDFSCKSEMSHQNAGEEHERDSQGHSEELDLAQ